MQRKGYESVLKDTTQQVSENILLNTLGLTHGVDSVTMTERNQV